MDGSQEDGTKRREPEVIEIKDNGEPPPKKRMKETNTCSNQLECLRQYFDNWKVGPFILNAKDLKDLCTSRAMINDNIINAAQYLIACRVPHIKGFQDVILGRGLHFKFIDINKEQFIQILHCGDSNHWLMVTNINAPENSIFVLDSLCQKKVPLDVVNQICNIVKPSKSEITIITLPCQLQMPIENNCALFSIANALSVALNKDPSIVIYDESQMRSHLWGCFCRRKIEPFPANCKAVQRNQKGSERIFICYKCHRPIVDWNDILQCSKLSCVKIFHRRCCSGVPQVLKEQFTCSWH